MPGYELKTSEPVMETNIFRVTHDRAEHPSGAVLDRQIVHNRPAAVMLARDTERRVLLIRQYRLPVRKELLELPAGRCDGNETPLETAQRELTEETGYRAVRWTPLTDFYSAPGFSTERMYAFLAEELTPGTASPEPYEIIEQEWLAWDDALKAVREGDIRDAKTIATLLYCEAFGL
ncbi:MAG: NUDIX hydrolase [Acidobacteria bacterium]|nr:NUDIX hydrolase [Acidobacteriota bacterium]